MLWKLNGVPWEDLVPVPKAQPGRHFTTGHRILGNLTSSASDAKYAQMTYGEHYRKKVEAALARERQRCADLLAEQKIKASAEKTLSPMTMKLGSSRTKPQPRYDLNELRHHQRRCAALLFGARERGAHKLPILVQWAPKRRESYYLMSERVYNDRVLMKMKADAGDSPLNFDFANTDGQTDDLHEFQQFITKTSKDIKGLSFDTKLKDYAFSFDREKRNSLREESTDVESGDERVLREAQDTKAAEQKSRRQVAFSDHVTESDTDAIDAKSFERSKRIENKKQVGELDPSDVDLKFDESPDERCAVTGEKSTDHRKDKLKKRDPKNSRSELPSPELLTILQETSGDNECSSDSTKENDSKAEVTTDMADEENCGLSGTGDKVLSPISADNLKHQNKHCKHTLEQKTQEYYRRLPKLLKTSELRARLPPKTQSQLEKGRKEVDHNCMGRHKIAYDRALTLARFRSLPSSYSFLSQNISNLNNFSYFPGLPYKKKVFDKDGTDDENDSMEKKKVLATIQSGRETIFGNIDMDDFYTPEDELIYFIKPEELKNIVVSPASDDESIGNEDEISSRSATTTLSSRTDTTKPFSSVDLENER